MVPRALQDKPELPDYLAFVYRAFWDLSTDRHITQGHIGAIPFTSIDRYATRFGLDSREEFERFLILLRHLDNIWLKAINKKTAPSRTSRREPTHG